MNEVLVFFDFSPTSFNVLRFAVDLAAKQKLFVTIVVINNTERKISLKDNYIVDNKLKTDFSYIFEEYSDKVPLNKFEFKILKDNTIKSTITLINELQVDLVLMSPRTTKLLRRLFFGRVELYIQANCNTPVIIFPSNYLYSGNVDDIYIFIDENEDTRQKLPIVRSIAHSFGSKVIIESFVNKTLNDKVERYKEQSISYLTKHGLRVEVASHEAELETPINTVDKIISAINTKDIDLVISMKSNFSDKIIANTSLTKKLIGQLNIPILSVPNRIIKRKRLG
ncbi:MAG: universal stress protein [Bacteroidales bacterium]|nr:universal stress protein [Bacteroidales bacterium]